MTISVHLIFLVYLEAICDSVLEMVSLQFVRLTDSLFYQYERVILQIQMVNKDFIFFPKNLVLSTLILVCRKMKTNRPFHVCYFILVFIKQIMLTLYRNLGFYQSQYDDVSFSSSWMNMVDGGNFVVTWDFSCTSQSNRVQRPHGKLSLETLTRTSWKTLP